MIQGKPIAVAIAIPAQDTVKTMFMYDVARMMVHTSVNAPQVKLHLLVARGSLIMRQRHDLATTVLEQSPDTTHILWLDTDMRFPKDTLLRLLSHNVEVVLGGYTERKPPFKPAVFVDSRDFTKRAWPTAEATGLLQIVAAGFGCVLTRVDVFQQMKVPYFHVGWSPDVKTFLGEDVYFFLQLAKLGIPAWLDQDLTKEIAHTGDFEYLPEHALSAERRREQEAAAAAEAKPE